MYKRKFNIGDKVYIKRRGRHIGQIGKIFNIVNCCGRIKYFIEDDTKTRIGWNFNANELDFVENQSKHEIKIDEQILLNEFNFEEVANYIIRKKLWGHFVENTGEWISITPEDFGIDTAHSGYITNCMHIDKNGKSSYGTKMIKWVPQNSLNHTKEQKKTVKVQKKETQNDFIWTISSTMDNCIYNYIV